MKVCSLYSSNKYIYIKWQTLLLNGQVFTLSQTLGSGRAGKIHAPHKFMVPYFIGTDFRLSKGDGLKLENIENCQP